MKKSSPSWKRWFGEDKDDEEEEELRGVSSKSYDFYGFGRSLKDESKDSKGGQSLYKTQWDEYEQTGVWRGYSYVELLDTTYITQMANLLAAKYNITVKPGEAWYVDVAKKELTYDPRSLQSGTKANLIVCLLHEMGHINYTTPTKKLKSPFLEKYPNAAHEVINVFEDLRIDTIMAKSYASAEDIYEANKPIVKKVAEGLQKRSEMMNEQIIEQIRKIMSAAGLIAPRYDDEATEPTDVTFEKWFPGQTKKDVKEKLTDLITSIAGKMGDTLFDYNALMLVRGYDEPVEPKNKRMAERIALTEHTLKPVKKDKNTQAVTARLDSDVYPHIEDLMKEHEEGTKEMKEALGSKLAKAIMDNVKGLTEQEMERQKISVRSGKKSGGGVDSRVPMGSGPSEDAIDKKWLEGNYNEVKNSVKAEIVRLTRYLKKVRAKEAVVRWEPNLKRGKINTKTLSRFASDNYRLFKKKHERIDTIAEYAVSVFVDTSGSMKGPASIHTMRAVVVLNEVFKALSIPYEIVTFDDHGIMVKNFEDDPRDAKRERKLAALHDSNGGSTNLHKAFKVSKADKYKKKNKICIILSDGGVGEEYSLKDHFERFRKNGVKTIGVSINAGPSIVRVCGGGVEIKSFSKIPEEFSNIIKSTLKLK